MIMKKNLYKILKISLLFVSLLYLQTACKERDDYPKFEDEVEEPPVEDIIPPDNSPTVQFKRIMDNTTYVKTFQMDTTYSPRAGVEYIHARFISNLDLPISMHILEIDLTKANVTMQVLSPYNDYLYATQHIHDMVSFNQATSEGEIIAATTGDANSSATAGGGYVKFGRVIQQLTGSTAQTRPHIGVRKGSSVIEIFNSPNQTTYPTDPINYSQMKHLVGGANWLVFNNDLIGTGDARAVRNAVGLTQDGQKVYVVTVDGIVANFSEGIGLGDLAKVMQALGCYKAFQPVSGNSTSLVLKQPGDPKSDWIRKNILQTYAGGYTGIGFVLLGNNPN